MSTYFQNRIVWKVVVCTLLWNGSVTAEGFCDTSTADACFDFTHNPTSFDILPILGDSTEWRDAGGVDNSGYLSLTDAKSNQRGTIVLPYVGAGGHFVFGARTSEANSAHHIDNLELTETDGRVKISAMLRIGGGTVRPSEGFSLNFVRMNDPLLSGDGEGYAGINGFENLPEEGSTTGISIGFDEWQNGPAPDPADPRTITTGDVVGISVRYDGEVISQAAMWVLNGELDDAHSLQTGMNSGGTQSLGWARFTLDAPALTENLSQNPIWSDFQLTWKGVGVEFQSPEPNTEIMTIMALCSFSLLRPRSGSVSS